MTFNEPWYDDSSQQVLADLARSVAELDGTIIEIGCWEGRSTCLLANVCHPEPVEAVDTWAGSPDEPCFEWAKHRDVYAAFQANIAELTRGNVNPHRMGWRDFFAQWDTPIKFIHIDAQHTYEEVRDNILAAQPLMVPDGVICGHDAPWEPVRRAATDTLGHIRIGASVWWQQQTGVTHA